MDGVRDVQYEYVVKDSLHVPSRHGRVSACHRSQTPSMHLDPRLISPFSSMWLSPLAFAPTLALPKLSIVALPFQIVIAPLSPYDEHVGYAFATVEPLGPLAVVISGP